MLIKKVRLFLMYRFAFSFLRQQSVNLDNSIEQHTDSKQNYDHKQLPKILQLKSLIRLNFVYHNNPQPIYKTLQVIRQNCEIILHPLSKVEKLSCATYLPS